MDTRVRLKKDLLVDDAVQGIDSVVDINDEGRYKYLLDIGHAVPAPGEPTTKRAPPPPARRSQQANEIGEVIAEAIRRGMTAEKLQEGVISSSRPIPNV